MKTIRIKKGREKPARGRHPWIFSGAVEPLPEGLEPGEIVEVVDNKGEFVGRGYCNPRSQIVVRLLTWDENEVVDAAFFARRLERALAGRASLIRSQATTAYRLVYAESDGLPGLVVDRYGDFLVLQCLTAGMEVWKPTLVELLWAKLSPAGIFERSDAESRRVYEGLPPAVGPLRGKEPPARLLVMENHYKFWVDLREGHKTGFYLDQRDNRQKVAAYCRGAKVLDAFSYTGAFGVYAKGAGAERIVHIDTSAAALDGARANKRANGFDDSQDEYIRGDVMEVLREFYRQGVRFDVVILDPPKFASSQAYLDRAARGYKDINLRGLQLVRPGGILATFSCSGAVSAELFQRFVFAASLDARREVQILDRGVQPLDHPVLLSFPESEYLKGLICRVW